MRSELTRAWDLWHSRGVWPEVRPGVRQMNTHSCECEHIAHMDRDRHTPNGNPSHRYGVEFNAELLQLASTERGHFWVCPDCAGDCQHGRIV